MAEVMGPRAVRALLEREAWGPNGAYDPRLNLARLIGLEVRYQHDSGNFGQTTEELVIVPFDLELPRPRSAPFSYATDQPFASRLTLTAHFDFGDRNGQIEL